MAKKGCGPLGCRNKLIYLKHISDMATPVVLLWILATSFWDDSGTWIDGETWND